MSASRHTYAVCIKPECIKSEFVKSGDECIAAASIIWNNDKPAVFSSKAQAEANMKTISDLYPGLYEVVQLR